MAADAIELRTQTLGQQFLKAGKEGFWQKLQGELRLDEKLIGWAMGHETLRVQLFRAIDALPSLTSKAEIARHLREYLADAAQAVPGMASLLNFGTDDPRSPQATLAATTFETAVKTLARRYICGANLEEALKTVENLRRDRYGFTVDLLGEAVVSETEARRYLERYLELMNALATRAQGWGPVPIVDGGPRLQVSVKLSAFYSRFDPLAPDTTRARVGEPVRVLLREAARLGCAVHFDMEQAAYEELTLMLLQEILQEPEFRDRDDVGITLQGYLRRSEQDLRGVLAWAQERGTPLTVRLVKGAYWDTETIEAYQRGWEQPVYNEKSHTDGNYETLIQLLLENHRYLYAAIGSHNARSIAKAIALAEQYQVPPRAFEVQALYGMGQKFLKPVVEMGHRVRVYCPYGELIPGMAYLIRRLLENTANTSFLRQSDLNEASLAQLLAAPPTPA
ncbi:MAG TPA: L-glutamate gamma-semialdehyde dehydrogenase, partial [Cyanobacteria bacterium UBA8156]|nr:L-glutamate gamma-semialdehyde dehydrogenase [Cyanobacteria bacterium UBA8156]